MADNPFDPPATAETNTPTKKENNMTDDTNKKLTATLKGGAGFDAPWIVIHGDTVEEVTEILMDENLKTLLDQTQKVGQYFAGQGKSSGPAPSRSGQPQASAAPPAGAPEAPGSDWVYKSGVSKAGKPWKAWMPPQGSTEKPVFFN